MTAPAPQPASPTADQARLVRVAQAINALHRTSDLTNVIKTQALMHKTQDFGVRIFSTRF